MVDKKSKEPGRRIGRGVWIGVVLVAVVVVLAIYRLRNPDWKGGARPLAYGERVSADGASLELVPSGHILGSAQVRIERGGA